MNKSKLIFYKTLISKNIIVFIELFHVKTSHDKSQHTTKYSPAVIHDWIVKYDKQVNC